MVESIKSHRQLQPPLVSNWTPCKRNSRALPSRSCTHKVPRDQDFTIDHENPAGLGHCPSSGFKSVTIIPWASRFALPQPPAAKVGQVRLQRYQGHCVAVAILGKCNRCCSLLCSRNGDMKLSPWTMAKDIIANRQHLGLTLNRGLLVADRASGCLPGNPSIMS